MEQPDRFPEKSPDTPPEKTGYDVTKLHKEVQKRLQSLQDNAELPQTGDELADNERRPVSGGKRWGTSTSEYMGGQTTPYEKMPSRPDENEQRSGRKTFSQWFKQAKESFGFGKTSGKGMSVHMTPPESVPLQRVRNSLRIDALHRA